MNDVVFAAFNAKDWDNVLAHVDPQCVLEIGPNNTLTGTAGAREIISYYLKFYEMRFISYHHFIDGNRSSTDATMRVKYLATEPGMPEARGQTADVPFACFGEVRNGKYTRIRMIFSFVDWLNIVS
ncbi:nuclear transport factor 2 family protein [Maritimibacter sp. DP1N21-5]|uniref:nuclear transport factor 2 family protein n=1 Tax=Maritimibacter sp. DP1N21-5 TaxID=2836867 RepID=UPI001C44CA50|nr:nuclear transport factor 2 family protein [Maritimibacter sp. DP1N21-5]MBV7410747.1 nuclear transport factor 2 family protein [Maritimibacter sp. DP1N21-5]